MLMLMKHDHSLVDFISYNFFFFSVYRCNRRIFVDPDPQAGDFQRKLEILNGTMTNDRRNRQVQYLGNRKYHNFDLDYSKLFFCIRIICLCISRILRGQRLHVRFQLSRWTLCKLIRQPI